MLKKSSKQALQKLQSEKGFEDDQIDDYQASQGQGSGQYQYEFDLVNIQMKPLDNLFLTCVTDLF